jgi:hypothetical protein
MDELAALLWIEGRKAVRSRMPVWTALGSLFLPVGIAFLILVAKNPEISQKLGLGQRQSQPDGIFRHRLANLPEIVWRDHWRRRIHFIHPGH